ncbi:cubilin-like isoform X1 [Pomacea canaliculata]|uniref:cubilin-like isoform X1 n=1 Tax=Pomacea canaliculata TaxID=400727 RepID=UPI000D73290C|nr:cubilin-like isoform X1 [Pomacea canaliculata]
MYIRFSSDGSVTYSGFRLTYEAVEQQTAPTSVCTSNGTTFSAVPGQVGYLTSLYYPSVYSGFISCSWTINSTSGYVVRSSILNVTNPEFYFYIRIYDGMSESSRTLVSFSSMPSQTVYYSSGQSMYIRLTTGGLSPNSLFNLTYDAVDELSVPTSVCTSSGTNFSAVPGQVGYLSSLYYPSVYSGFISCSWTIISTSGYVVKATVLNATNPQFYFNIVIYDGMSESSRSLASFSSTPSQTVYYSYGQSMYIRLSTYGLSPNASFSLTYEAVDESSAPTSVCTSHGTTFSAVPGQVSYLTSLYWPSVYSGFIFCSWTINSTTGYVVKATVLNVTNAEFYFYIWIYDGMSESSRTLSSISSMPSQTVYYSSGQSMYITLTTYGLSPNLLFSLTYEAVDELSAPMSVCTSNGTTFSAVPGQVGYLPSLYFPSVYSGFISCSWTIISTSGYVVKATILNVTNPRFNIFIYDGMSASSPSLASISSVSSPTVYYSSGQSMYIWVATYGLSPNSIFFLTYEAVDQLSAKLSVCSVNAPTIYAVPGQVAYLTSPNYPSSYYNNADCRWLIDAGNGSVVKVTVLNVNLETCCDYLELYNGSQISSSSLIIRTSSMPSQSVFNSSGQYMYIRFYSNDSVTSSGFRLTYEAVDQQSVPTSVCSVNATTVTAVPGQVGYLTSPNYPSPYYNKADCRWLIDAGSGYVVKVFNLSLEAGFLELYDGTQLSNTFVIIKLGSMTAQSVFYSSGQYMYIRFYSNSNLTYPGFRLSYDAVDQQSVATSACSVNTTALSAVVGEVSYLESPDYPNYPNNTSCQWLISAPTGYIVRVTLLVVSLDECCDYLNFVDGMSDLAPSLGRFYALPSQRLLNSSGQYMYINFSTNGIRRRGGFNLYYEAVLLSECPVDVKNVSVIPGEIRYLTSPNYPLNYHNNADCRWLLSAPSGYVVRVTIWTVNVDLYNDYLQILEGMLDSSSIDTFRSTPSQKVYSSCGQYMLIRFYTNFLDVSLGFNLTYETVLARSCFADPTELTAEVRGVKRLSSYSLYYNCHVYSNVSCQWLITAPTSCIVMVTFSDVVIRECCGYVNLVDGMSDSDPSLGRFNATPSQRFYNSSGQHMYVNFSNNGIRVSGDFTLYYEAVRLPDPPITSTSEFTPATTTSTSTTGQQRVINVKVVYRKKCTRN